MKLLNKFILILILFTLFLFSLFSYLLFTNKTFFKNYYTTVDNKEIYLPKYSYFKDECCMYSASFISLKSKKDLQKEINQYLKNFTYFENDTTFGYLKNDLFIQRYGVEDKGLYRIIYIVY